VDEAAEKGLVGQFQSDSAGDEFVGGADGNAVCPEVFAGEFIAAWWLFEHFGQACGDGDVLDGVEAEQHDSAVDGADLAWESVES